MELLQKYFRKEYAGCVCILIFLMIPNILYCFHSPEIMDKGVVDKLFFLLLAMSVYSLPFIIFSFRTSLFVLSPLVLLSFLEYYHIYTFGTVLNESSLFAILGTNFSEAKELLSSLFLWIIFIFAVFSVYIIWAFKSSYKLSKRARKTILMCVLSVTFLNLSYNVAFNYKKGLNLQDDVEMSLNSFKLKYEKIYPISVITKSAKILDVRKYQKLSNDFSFNAKSTEEDSVIYVFVVGESSRYKNWEINGYHRKTSPYLMNTDNVLSFSNYYSSSNTTLFSLPFLYTRGTPDNQTPLVREKTMAAFYKEIGFRTYLIDNQNLFSSGNLFRYKNEFDEYVNLCDSGNNVGEYDSRIFNDFDRILNEKEKKKFITVQLRGSHFKYAERYPKEFEVFQPVETKGLSVDKKDKEAFINSYDNSILYTDYILHELISKVKARQKKSAVLFVSDHGQNLFDDADNLLHGSPVPYKSEFHVPFFIWFSDGYMDSSGNNVVTATGNVDKKLTSENVFYTLINLSNVVFKTNDLSKSVLSDSFEEDSVRRVLCPNGIFDFD